MEPLAVFLIGMASGIVIGLALDRYVIPVVVDIEAFLMRRFSAHRRR